MNIGYVRVSSEKFNEAKQKDALVNYDIQEWCEVNWKAKERDHNKK